MAHPILGIHESGLLSPLSKQKADTLSIMRPPDALCEHRRDVQDGQLEFLLSVITLATGPICQDSVCSCWIFAFVGG